MGYERLQADLKLWRTGGGALSLSESEFVLHLAEILRQGAHHWSHDIGRSCDYLIRHYGLGGSRNESVEEIATAEKRHPETIRLALKIARDTLRRGITKYHPVKHKPNGGRGKTLSSLAHAHRELRGAAKDALVHLDKLPRHLRSRGLDHAIAHLAALCNEPE